MLTGRHAYCMQRIEATSPAAVLASKNFAPKSGNKLAAAARLPAKTGSFSYLVLVLPALAVVISLLMHVHVATQFWLKIDKVSDDWTQLFHRGTEARARNPAVFIKPKSTKYDLAIICLI